VDDHGKESFNFQLSILIYELVASVSIFIGIGCFLLPLIVVAHYGAIILGVIGGIKANEGVLYRYPLNLRLIK
jgi:uncharacterized Tic20 family protein